jgi:hypothetical protein
VHFCRLGSSDGICIEALPEQRVVERMPEHHQVAVCKPRLSYAGVTRDAQVEEDSLRFGYPIPWRWAKEPQQVCESLIAI